MLYEEEEPTGLEKIDQRTQPMAIDVHGCGAIENFKGTAVYLNTILSIEFCLSKG